MSSASTANAEGDPPQAEQQEERQGQAPESAPDAAAPAAPAPARAPSPTSVWSTRVHREILSLTEEEGKAASPSSSSFGSPLPPYVILADHTISLDRGVCDATFRVEVELPPENVMVPKSEEGGEEGAGAGSSGASDTDTDADADADADEGSGKAGKDSEGGAAADAVGAAAEAVALPRFETVTVLLDASADPGSAGPSAYPFCPPRAMILSGSHLFPEGSDVRDGDVLALDLDWTPSLHLSDAVLNVALKARESIRRGEPFYCAGTVHRDDMGREGAGATPAPGLELVEDALYHGAKTVGDGARSAAAYLSTGFSSLREKGLGMAGEAKEGLSSKMKTKERKENKAQRKATRSSGSAPAPGDEIDLAAAPWNVCSGMYACKAIRRPTFVENAIAAGVAREKHGEAVSSRVPGGGGKLLTSIRSSAKAVLEESFLMITDDYIIEMATSKFSVDSGKVTYAMPISNLAKLKFRREESISLFFKQSPEDPVILMCPDSADCVKQIQIVLKKHGVRGKHTNAAMQRSIQTAMSIVLEIQKKEKALAAIPTVENVQLIMDLYRQAAERFEQAGDKRHEEVMVHLKKFLANSITASILDGSYEERKRKMAEAASPPPKPVPEGEVLTSPDFMRDLDDNDDDDDDVHAEDGLDSIQRTDDMIAEAKRDIEQLGGTALLDVLNASAEGTATANGADEYGLTDDAMEELDAMLKDADAELANLMSS